MQLGLCVFSAKLVRAGLAVHMYGIGGTVDTKMLANLRHV